MYYNGNRTFFTHSFDFNVIVKLNANIIMFNLEMHDISMEIKCNVVACS